jgi:predicted acylesterase/phospholipase RssA
MTRKIAYEKKVFSLEWQNSIFSNSYNIVQKTIDITLSQNEKRSLTSRPGITYIHPNFGDLDYYEFHRYKEFISLGYQKAKEILDEEMLSLDAF